MTSNQQRAVEVLNRHWSVAQETQQDDEAACCAQALADAGLLMPDLPEPDREGDWGPGWEGVVEAEPGRYAVRVIVGGRQFRQSSQYARLFALALLAAAEEAEELRNDQQH